jgi:hypothetical protein
MLNIHFFQNLDMQHEKTSPNLTLYYKNLQFKYGDVKLFFKMCLILGFFFQNKSFVQNTIFFWMLSIVKFFHQKNHNLEYKNLKKLFATKHLIHMIKSGKKLFF